MRPYFAVVKDSFREALRSPVLWVLVAMITVCLLVMAPFGAREQTNTEFGRDDIKNWRELGQRLDEQYASLVPSPGKRLWGEFDPELQQKILALELPGERDFAALQEFQQTIEQFRAKLSALIQRSDLYDPVAWQGVRLNREARELEAKGLKNLSDAERTRFHRLAIESAYPDLFRARPKTSFVLSYGPWEPLWPGPLPIAKADFHKQIGAGIAFLSDLIVGLVVVFVAILATAPMIPRMFDQGQLHLLLSKPVSRSLLLVSQFLGGCAYVFILTTYLVVGMVLILGTRVDYWNLKLLWMIPVYVFMFAIYYTVSTASAVVWRSTLMSIISGVLFFLVTFSLGTSKVVIEDGLLTLQRTRQIVPVGDGEVLAINERGVVSRWSEDDKQWKVTFLPQELEGIGDLATFMPASLASVGPVYLPKEDAIFAVQYPAMETRGPVNIMPQISAIGRASNQFSHVRGAAPPVGTLAVFVEPEGTAILVSNLGIARMLRDPTVRQQPPRILGVTLPLPAASPFASALATKEVQFASPARAAYHAPTQRLVVYSRGELTTLRRNADKKYEVVKQRKLDAEESEAIALATSGKQILVGRTDGRLQLLSFDTLEELSVTSPQSGSSARFVAASDDGRFAVVFHNGRLWQYDPASDAWSRARVSGQGDISAATFVGNELLVGDFGSRISAYDADGKLVRRTSPTLNYFQWIYYYIVRPAYWTLPKPGELGKTLQYLLTGKETAATGDNQSGDEVTAVQAKLNPWAPVWSGLVFIVVVLTATCVYFERQEY